MARIVNENSKCFAAKPCRIFVYGRLAGGLNARIVPNDLQKVTLRDLDFGHLSGYLLTGFWGKTWAENQRKPG
jgi:hypothetical protein